MRLFHVAAVATILIAGPVAAQDNNAAAVSNETVTENVTTTDINATGVPAPEATAPATAAPATPAPKPAPNFPWGVLGLLGLIGLFGRKRD